MKIQNDNNIKEQKIGIKNKILFIGAKENYFYLNYFFLLSLVIFLKLSFMLVQLLEHI
jgi:hypothetical protein